VTVFALCTLVLLSNILGRPEFRPTVAPPGRLVRLGVVLDPRNDLRRLAQIASMCDRAGIDIVWVRDSLADPVAALTVAAAECRRARVGAVLTASQRTPTAAASMAQTLNGTIDGRLELGISSRAQSLEGYVRELRELLRTAGTDDGPIISVEAATPREAQVAARLADNVLIPAGAMTDAGLAVAEVLKACAAAGREPRTLGIAVELPVSIGRTSAEALARAEAEPLFRQLGQQVQAGIIGRLEECQDRVIELAHAGVTDLQCILPNVPDIHDVIAQLTSMVVGNHQTLTPGSPRSKSPDPPQSWGGRYDPSRPAGDPAS
jgi:alkanesulfonate monooxygenase SsuD/methylene tetrahydromethanopterin reductase-like flavin-dependent oxidoreductase (luciferase family)